MERGRGDGKYRASASMKSGRVRPSAFIFNKRVCTADSAASLELCRRWPDTLQKQTRARAGLGVFEPCDPLGA
eukprot:11213927-Lingulodinium_polyedra.AAC.1